MQTGGSADGQEPAQMAHKRAIRGTKKQVGKSLILKGDHLLFLLDSDTRPP